MSKPFLGRKSLLVGLLTASFLTACGTVEPPTVPPSDITSYPALVEKGYAETIVSGTFPMDLATLRLWLEEDNKMVNQMEATENIAKPIRMVPLSGAWPVPGAARRVELSDGHFVLERIVSNTPDRFEYQIWGMTQAAGRNVDHIHGVQAFEELSDGSTQLTWSYRVKPKAGFMRPFVQRFVDNDVTPFLTQAIENTVALAEEEIANADDL